MSSTITRRQFNVGGFLSLLALTVCETGCGFVSTLLSLVPTLMTALGNLLAMISNAGIVLPSGVLSTIGTITTTAGDLVAALKSWTPGATLADIDTLLGDLLAAFQNLIGLLPPLPAAIVDLVLLGLQLILGTIQSLLAQQDASSMVKSHAKMIALRSAKFQGKTITLPNVTRPSKRQFTHSWNGIANMPSRYRV